MAAITCWQHLKNKNPKYSPRTLQTTTCLARTPPSPIPALFDLQRHRDRTGRAAKFSWNANVDHWVTRARRCVLRDERNIRLYDPVALVPV